MGEILISDVVITSKTVDPVDCSVSEKILSERDLEYGVYAPERVGQFEGIFARVEQKPPTGQDEVWCRSQESNQKPVLMSSFARTTTSVNSRHTLYRREQMRLGFLNARITRLCWSIATSICSKKRVTARKILKSTSARTASINGAEPCRRTSVIASTVLKWTLS